MDVEKPGRSAGHLVETGFEVHLHGEPYLQKGKRRLPLLKHNNVFYLRARLLTEQECKDAGMFPLPATGGESASAGAASSSSGAPAAAAASSSRAPAAAAASAPKEAPPRARVQPDGHPAVAPALPIVVSNEERKRHNLTHLPFRKWCPICVSAKAADPAHRRKAEGDPPTLPICQVDFFFMNRRAERETATGITLVCCTTGAIAGCGIPAKSNCLFVVEFLRASLLEWD